MAQDLISWPTNALRVCYQTHFHREMNRVSRPNWLFAQQQWGNVTAAWHYVNGQWLLIMTRDHFHSRSAANCEPLPPPRLDCWLFPLILAFLNAYRPWDFFSINNPFYRRWSMIKLWLRWRANRYFSFGIFPFQLCNCISTRQNKFVFCNTICNSASF